MLRCHQYISNVKPHANMTATSLMNNDKNKYRRITFSSLKKSFEFNRMKNAMWCMEKMKRAKKMHFM